ncbi:hypothetical protein bmyco0002_59910 [Bacillus pseudomycoides]|nr:hypothetical protein bmyco0002_59910 [Bacillus pseudomycoides]
MDSYEKAFNEFFLDLIGTNKPYFTKGINFHLIETIDL